MESQLSDLLTMLSYETLINCFHFILVSPHLALVSATINTAHDTATIFDCTQITF